MPDLTPSRPDPLMTTDPLMMTGSPADALGAPPAGAAPPQPDPAPPGNDAAHGPSGAEGGVTELENTLQDVQAGRDLSVENSIFYGDVYHILEAQRRTTRRHFSFADGRAATESEERWASGHFHETDGEAEALVRHLEEHRVLLLAAGAGARKVTAALHLALRLRGGRALQPALVFDPVERNVRLDVRAMPLKHDEFRDRVVIFRYPLSRGNPDVAQAFARTGRAGWAQLADLLRERNAYLVFTATPSEAEQFRASLQGVHRVLAPHPPDRLARPLDNYLSSVHDDADRQVADALRAFRDVLAERFAFEAQVADFVGFYARLGDPSLPPEQAHALFQDTSKRLLHDLDDDFDGWSFGFALALAQCAPDANGVPWVDFDRLRRHLRRWLRRDLQLGASAEPEADAEPSEVRLELSDDTLLTRSRARVEKDPSSLADTIRFCDGRPAQGVWRVLLDHHRRVLTAILPRLRELAERPDPEGRSLGVLAAQIVGRIGAMDPERVTVPAAERWAGLGGRHHGLVGALYEGVLGSDDARYRAHCLQLLETFCASSATPAAKRRVEAAAAAYSWVGYYDFPLAMRQLYAVVRAHLVPMIEDATRMSRLVAQLQTALLRAAGNDGRAGHRVHEVLRSLVDRIYHERGGIFLGVQFSLVSLCASNGVAPVLKELRGWMGQGGASTGVLVALMFMHERGIASQLHEDRASVARGEGAPPATCGQFVRALANGEEDVQQAARFLGDLYDSVTSPWAAESLVRRHFRDRLQADLLQWVQDALPVPELVPPVRKLFEQLTRTPADGLRELVLELVAGGEFARRPELRAFTRSLQL